MESPTEAEQNRLIIETMDLVEPIAAYYRGQKGILFDDLVAEGRVGLVKAARSYVHSRSQFKTWAAHHIHGAIQHLIRDSETFEPFSNLNEELDDKIYEWRLFQTPYESWEKLAATPEEILGAWEDLRDARNSLSGAMISLSKRERAILDARFLKEPNQSLESIARDHKISYARIVFLISRALKKLKQVIEAQQKNAA